MLVFRPGGEKFRRYGICFGNATDPTDGFSILGASAVPYEIRGSVFFDDPIFPFFSGKNAELFLFQEIRHEIFGFKVAKHFLFFLKRHDLLSVGQAILIEYRFQYEERTSVFFEDAL